MDKGDGRRRPVPRVQLLSFDGCPLAGAARVALESALVACGLSATGYEVVDILDSSTPEELAHWGSPTILVDGRDVTGHGIGQGVSCRVYDTPGQVPDTETIANAISARLAT